MNVLIIHDERNVRHDRLRQELESQNIDLSNVTFIPPVYMENPKNGVSAAHKNCIRYAKEKGWKRVIVMENDIRFTHPNSFNFFLEGFNELPDDWEIYLGGAYSYKFRENINENLHHITNFHAFHLYAVNSEYYDGYLNIRDDWHIDVALGYEANTYLRFPIPSIQHNGYSESFKRDLEHDYWTKKLYLYNGSKTEFTKGNDFLQRRV